MSRRSVLLLMCSGCVLWLLAACTPSTQVASQPPSDTPLPPTPLPSATQAALPSATPSPTLQPTQAPSRTVKPSQTPKAAGTKTPAPTATTEEIGCPGAPAVSLKKGDWARVSVDPPMANKLRSQPGVSADLLGHVQPGENVLVLDGPQCADGYNWWLVRSLGGLEGWTVEGDAAGYWLVEPVYAWYQLPAALKARGTKTYNLRELSISPDQALIQDITGSYSPLATPLPRPENEETPAPDDPRYSDFGSTAYAAHSFYDMTAIDGSYYWLWVYDLQDPLSRYYLNNLSYNDCTAALKKNLEGPAIEAEYLQPFCGVNGGIPLLFKAGVRLIQFDGGKGVRYLMASANYQTVDHMEYRFQGLSDDGRYYLSGLFRPILHPYMIERQLIGSDFGWLLEWKDGQYEEAQKTYDIFNSRIAEMLNAGVVTIYPSLELLDEMLASIVIIP